MLNQLFFFDVLLEGFHSLCLEVQSNAKVVMWCIKGSYNTEEVQYLIALVSSVYSLLNLQPTLVYSEALQLLFCDNLLNNFFGASSTTVDSYCSSLYNSLLTYSTVSITKEVALFNSGLDALTTLIVIVAKYNFFFCVMINLLYLVRTLYIYQRLGFDNFIDKFNWFNEVEHELGAVDDFFFFLGFLIFFFSWYFMCYNIVVIFNVVNFNWIVQLFISILFLIFVLPLSLLYDFGIAFFNYIRGVGSSSNLLIECVFDFLAITIIFVRFLIQNIRFVLIFLAFVELFEWTYVSPYSSFVNNLSLSYVYNFWNLEQYTVSDVYLFLLTIFIQILLFLYYLVHLLILLFIQISTYLLLSFWLFFFLYTSFFLTKYEKHFFFKRHILSLKKTK